MSTNRVSEFKKYLLNVWRTFRTLLGVALIMGVLVAIVFVPMFLSMWVVGAYGPGWGLVAIGGYALYILILLAMVMASD